MCKTLSVPRCLCLNSLIKQQQLKSSLTFCSASKTSWCTSDLLKKKPAATLILAS